MLNLKDPKEIVVNEKTYIISKFFAVEGRHIMTQYLVTALPKIGSYQENEKLMLELMKKVAVREPNSGQEILLTTQALINNHVDSWETLVKLEKEMLAYNFSFFQNGGILDSFTELLQNLPELDLRKLTGSLGLSSQTEKQPSTN